MKIKMIGTGAISVKQRSACSLIDNKILIDCGNGTVKTLLEQNVDIKEINTLLITHLHGDHFLDIPFLIMQRKFCSSSNELNIYCPKGTEKVIGKIINFIYSDIEDWKVLRDKTKVKFIEFENLTNKEVTNGYFVDSYEVMHGDFKPAYGFILKNGDKSVGFSGDSIYCKNIETIVKKSDISILDMSFIDGNNKHMGVHDIENLVNKYNKKIIATHMSESARQYGNEIKNSKLIIPNDGDEFVI